MRHIRRLTSEKARAIRTSLGMTQKQFSDTFGIPLDTIRSFETGRRKPTGAYRILFLVIEKEPRIVQDIVATENTPKKNAPGPLAP